MSTKEIVSFGNPYRITKEDRSFGGGTQDVLVVSDGIIGVAPGDVGNIIMGGRTVLGDPGPIAVAAKVGDGVAVTLKLRDCAGNQHSGIRKVFVWLSGTAGLGTGTTDSVGLTTTVTTGVLINSPTAQLALECLTDATGTLVVLVTDTNGTQTRFVNFAIDGKIFSSAAVITT